MTQIFREDGRVIPVTALKVGPCVVVRRKTADRDGYEALQMALVDFVKPKHITKAEAGHCQKAGVEPARFLREFRVKGADSSELKAGDRVLAEQFHVAEKVDVIGTSKGCGFAGVVKRHNFRGGCDTHGSMSHRAPGSIGASSYPSRVFKGTRMAGRMGGKQVTARNLEIVEILPDENVILVRGAVPGPNGGKVMVRRTQ